MADTTAIAAEHADRPAKQRLSTDAKWIVATGATIALLQVAFVSMTFQQNATFNARIDDTNRTINQRFSDQSQLINQRFSDQSQLTNQRFSDQNHRIDRMQTDIREIRNLLLQILERTAPAN